MVTLYGYWRSSAAYRVRIALNLLGIEHQLKSVHLVKDGGQQHSDAYAELNPNHLVPTLVDGDIVLNQSLAIIEYLDEVYGGGFYPENRKEKYLVKALAQDIACDIHPLNNLRVLKYLSSELKADDTLKSQWYAHWINTGFTGLEKSLNQYAGQFCFADKVSVADLCLVPQVYNAKRFNVDLQAFPTINRIAENCNLLAAFDKALPENQDDSA